MTKYHSDDYIKFLRSIRPDNMSEYSKQMQRCGYHIFSPSIRHNFTVFFFFFLTFYCHIPLLTVNVGEDCPVFDGLFEFCQLSTGGSVGMIFELYLLLIILYSHTPDLVVTFLKSLKIAPIVLLSSGSSETEQAADRHRHQLGWRSPSRQEV